MSGATASALVAPDTVRFDFRFGPNLKEHEKKLGIRRELAYMFARSHGNPSKLRGITLYPVARAGKSGSEVFYLDLTIVDHELPERFIAKFQDRNLTNQEGESANDAVINKLCSKVSVHLHETEDLGIIVYNLASSRDHIEFRGYFLDLGNSDENCAVALKATFQMVEGISNNVRPSKKLIDDFSWYVDRKSKPLQRISALTVVAPAQIGIGRLATSILEAYQHIARDLNVEIHPYFVHGDLHARNLMLSKSNPARTELIDFGWVHFGHPAKDFVLMECTLKYMLLPEVLPVAKGKATDNLYFQANDIEAFEQLLCEHSFNLPSVDEMLTAVFGDTRPPAHQVRALIRVYICLVEVRRAAGRVLDSYCATHPDSKLTAEQHYFASFFLVTLGLLGISEMDQFSAMIGLQTVGGKLC